MTTTIVHSGNLISVKSPYDKAFARSARSYGGNWNPREKLWQFDTRRGYTVPVIQEMCAAFYPEVQVADALPVPAALPVQPDFGFFGIVGQVFAGDLEITKIVDFTGRYGATRLHLMRNADGQVFTWFASTARLEVGPVRLTGQIKAHTPREGVSQTVLTRCKKI